MKGMTMAERTLTQIEEEILVLQKERDLASLNGAKQIQAALVSGKVATLADDLEALLPSVAQSSITGSQTSSLITVLRGTKSLLDSEISRIEKVVQDGE